MKPEKVGKINEFVISALNLSLIPDTPILLGETNINHMESEHPEDFKKYFAKLGEILSDPDYVAKHPKKDSIEYIKKYYDAEKEDYVLVAVRASNAGIIYARSLFVMGDEKVKNYKTKGYFKQIKKP